MSGAQAAPVDLARHVEDWRPPATDHADVITARRVHELAATLDIDESFADGDGVAGAVALAVLPGLAHGQ